MDQKLLIEIAEKMRSELTACNLLQERNTCIQLLIKSELQIRANNSDELKKSGDEINGSCMDLIGMLKEENVIPQK